MHAVLLILHVKKFQNPTLDLHFIFDAEKTMPQIIDASRYFGNLFQLELLSNSHVGISVLQNLKEFDDM